MAYILTVSIDLKDGRTWQSIANVRDVAYIRRPRCPRCRPVLLSPFDGRNPERIRVEFLHFLRSEQKFADAEILKRQILEDVDQARALLAASREAAAHG